MAASLCASSLTETIVGGFLQIEYTRTYKMNLADTTEAEATALNTAGVDAIAAPYVFNGIPVYCYQRVPRRSNDDNERLLWYVTCSFTNDTSRFMRNEQGQPIQVNSGESVLDVAPQVDISFESTEVRDKEGEFLGLYTYSGIPAATPTGTYLKAFQIGKIEQVQNTSGQDFLDDQYPITFTTKTKYTYWKVVRDWDNTWPDIIGKHNSDSVTITQRDVDGVRLQKTYAANQLKLHDIIKQDLWVDGKLFFKVGFVLGESSDQHGYAWPDAPFDDPTVNYFSDKGTRRLIFQGQYKPDGTTYTSDELIELTGSATGWVTEEIRDAPDALGISAVIGEPMFLNGAGATVWTRRYNDAPGADSSGVYKLAYRMGNFASFSALGIS